jgi:hypothetical protein
MALIFSCKEQVDDHAADAAWSWRDWQGLLPLPGAVLHQSLGLPMRAAERRVARQELRRPSQTPHSNT